MQLHLNLNLSYRLSSWGLLIFFYIKHTHLQTAPASVHDVMVHGSLGHLPFMLGNLALHFSLSSSKLCTTTEKERDQTVLKQYKLQTTDFYLLNEQKLQSISP